MTRLLGYFALAVLALPLQAVLLPPLLPGGIKPDLLLLLSIWIGLREPPWQGGAVVYAIGWLYGGYAGIYPGLHGFVLLAVFLTVCGMATRLNTESQPLLWYLVGGGTLLQGALTVFALEFFANVQGFWLVLLNILPAQMLVNLLAAYLLRWGALRLRAPTTRTPLHRVLPAGRRHET